MKQAQDKANEIITQAHMQAREIKKRQPMTLWNSGLPMWKNTLLNSLNQIRETKSIKTCKITNREAVNYSLLFITKKQVSLPVHDIRKNSFN